MLSTKFGIFSIAAIFLICTNSLYSQVGIDNTNQQVGIGPNEAITLVALDFFGGLGGNLPSVDALDIVFYAPQSLQFSGVATPPVVNISGLGIFGGASTVFTPANLSASSAAEASLSILSSEALVEGAPVAEVILDTTGLSPGDTVIFGFNNATASTSFFNDGVAVDTTFVLTNGFTVSVPEPSTVTFMLTLGSVVLVRRMRV